MFLKKKKLFILIKDIQHSIKITIIREKKVKNSNFNDDANKKQSKINNI